MLGSNGGLVGRSRIASSARASGVWLPSEQSYAQLDGRWPRLFPSLDQIVYTQSSVYGGTTPVSNALMTDGVATNTGAATNNNPGEFFKLDLGAPYAINEVLIGTGTSAIPGGWNRTYTENKIMQYSIDDSVWIEIFNTGVFPSDGIFSFRALCLARYLRLVDPGNSWITLTEFVPRPAGANQLAALAADPWIGSVSLLVQMNGPNNGIAFTDTGPQRRIITSNGNTRITTDHSRFNGSSGVFDGSGDTLVFPAVTFVRDFTAEAWFRAESITEDRCLMGNSSGNVQVFRFNPDGNTGSLGIFNNSGWMLGPAVMPTLASGDFYHVAATRDNGVCRLFVNGILIAANSSFLGSLSINTIGAGFGGSFNFWRGNMNAVRLTSFARYTANFTPPDSPPPDAP